MHLLAKINIHILHIHTHTYALLWKPSRVLFVVFLFSYIVSGGEEKEHKVGGVWKWEGSGS